MKISLDNRQICDMALFSFLKIIAKINKVQHILDYRKDEELKLRMPKYKVEMGFGLHQGWAIEGAIGSFFKIDASYLSPNVNMASRLQAASKQYGVYILVSHLFYYVLTPEVREICREIDRITVKGSN
jgi:class 3 adenylate cyclase